MRSQTDERRGPGLTFLFSTWDLLRVAKSFLPAKETMESCGGCFAENGKQPAQGVPVIPYLVKSFSRFAPSAKGLVERFLRFLHDQAEVFGFGLLRQSSEMYSPLGVARL
jgi:hypothetical protein